MVRRYKLGVEITWWFSEKRSKTRQCPHVFFSSTATVVLAKNQSSKILPVRLEILEIYKFLREIHGF